LAKWIIVFVLLSSACVQAQDVPTTTNTAQESSPAPANDNNVTAEPSQHEKAEQELKEQERQRILGIVPNFNTTNVQNAAPLSVGQKFRLSFHSAIDPFEFVAAALDAGYSQWQKDFPGYGLGAPGYAKRFGAAYADQFSGIFWGNAVYPSLLHEDPRYFRQGEGTVRHRGLHAIASTVWTKHDNGTWGPNYANVLGNLTAGGLSNIYYPATDRGVELTLERAATVTAEGVLGAIFVEFWPDISQKLFHHN